jgi:RimJ/RimL family protein N-acetyltransferase
VTAILTEHLDLRTPRLADAQTLFAFMGDPAAMSHTHFHATLRDLRRCLAGHDCQRRRIGFGPWTIRERATGAIVGFGGLYDDPFDPGWGLEVGYFFAPAAWGRGYAGELVRRALAVARASGVAPVRAFAHPANVASRRVLERAGFATVRYVQAMDRLLYAAG